MFFTRRAEARPRRRERRYRPLLAHLEERLPLNASPAGLVSAMVMDHPLVPVLAAETGPLAVDSLFRGNVTAPSPVKHPLSAAPALSSLIGAPASLYLNFQGDFVSSYGAYHNITVPAFDQDGDASTFTDAELGSIAKIWSYVAEDYAPFNINVTTVAPANMSHRVTEKVNIGGDGAWTGGWTGGLTYVNNFTMTGLPNIAFVFSRNLSQGDPKYVGDAASHEAAHAFGLNHQSKYSGTTLTQQYYTGPGDGTAPLMGGSYPERRSLWWYGPSNVSAKNYQDDMAILANPNNGFGYRPQTASSLAAPLPLSVRNGSQVSSGGVIVTTSEVDTYAFRAGRGTVSFTVSVPADVSNLAPRLTLLSASGAILATAGPSAADFSARLTVTLPAEGSYRIMVSSNGGYGNVGNYTVRGTIVPPASPGGGDETSGDQGGAVVLVPPAHVTAAPIGPGRIDVYWSNVAGATGYLVERSTDGATWSGVGTAAQGVTSLSDLGVAPGAAYDYRVTALYGLSASLPSAVVHVKAVAGSATTGSAAAPSLTVVSRSPRRVRLSWKAGSSSTRGYVVERSSNNGRSWTVVARLNARRTGYTDARVSPGRTYLYRVRAYDAAGASAPGRLVRAHTPRGSVRQAARRRTW